MIVVVEQARPLQLKIVIELSFSGASCCKIAAAFPSIRLFLAIHSAFSLPQGRDTDTTAFYKPVALVCLLFGKIEPVTV